MSTNERENAQLTGRDLGAGVERGTPTLLYAEVVGEPNAHGFQTRGMRLATKEDVKALRKTLR